MVTGAADFGEVVTGATDFGEVVTGATDFGAAVEGTKHGTVTVMVVGPVAVMWVGAHLWSLQVVMVTVVASGQKVVKPVTVIPVWVVAL